MVELEQMLLARERRAWRQAELLHQYKLPLVSFSMNIAGPIKNSDDLRRCFALGRDQLLGQLSLLKANLLLQEEIDEETGCEGLYVVDVEPQSLKSLTIDIEEHSPLGRLFDLDVILPGMRKMDRPQPRRCLICDRPAKECARSRTHTVAELQARTAVIVRNALREQEQKEAADLSVRALLYEVTVTPKPGLVDRFSNGSHKDMDFYSFMASASTLWPYFASCVRLGQESSSLPAPETLSRLRFPGKLAEADMLAATGGVNTHKGAIFTLGIVCGALGRLPHGAWKEPERVLNEVKAMCEGILEEFSGLTEETAKTAGQRWFVKYGIQGVRGQAAQGFPAVLAYGLPTLEEGLSRGLSNDEAGAGAMLTLLAHCDDTNMISRGGYQVQQETAKKLRELLSDTPYPSREMLVYLDEDYSLRNLSPGGSADLLALCWLLHFLKEGN